MPFRFEYYRILRTPVGEWAQAELRFLGFLRAGAISRGEFVLVPVVTTIARVPVVRFMEEFDDWTGLPFSNTADFDQGTFFHSQASCIGVDASSIPDLLPICPGALRAA